MATKRTTTRSSTGRSAATRKRTSRRPTAGALTPRRRPSRPGLPTTVGTALGTLVVTTLLDLSWPVRLGLIALVVVLGLAYVVYRNRAAIVAGAAAETHTAYSGVAPGVAPPPLRRDRPEEPRDDDPGE